MEIKKCTNSDTEEIFKLYKIASNYQKAKKEVVVWPDFKKELVETEIKENRQWKMIIDNEIATNPNFRGNNFVFSIVEWAKKYANSLNKQFVRLDTLGNNIKLIEHYKNAGFDFLGMFDLENTDSLPEHYHNTPACLFEINLRKSTDKAKTKTV